MTMFRNLGLLTKIFILLLLILLSFFALASFVNYRQQKAFILLEAVDKARLIAYEAIRTREYISDQLLTGSVDLSEDRYGLIPVVASNRIGQLVARDLDYSIRQVSDRYRNPANAPDTYEKKILQLFRNNRNLRENYSIVTQGDKAEFRYLQPFSADASCLECHGKPEQAPEYIRRLFPEEKDQAYHYRIGEIIGAASVTIPMDRLYRQVFANMRNTLLNMVGVMAAMMLCLGILIRAAVTRPLGRLGSAIQSIIHTGRFEKKIPRRGKDEIGVLIDGFNELTDHLREKTEHLKESEKRFRLMTETARDGIISFLENGQIFLFNRQAERLFGYGKQEVLGMDIAQLVHEDCTVLQDKNVAEYLNKNRDELILHFHQFSGRRRDGLPVSLEVSLSVAESDGHLFYTAILRDHR